MGNSILDALVDVEAASQEQTKTNLAIVVALNEKEGKIDQEVALAIQRTDQAIADVNAAIPNAVEDTLFRIIYVDPVVGDDTKDGTSVARAVKTMKVAVNKTPRFGRGRIEIQNNITIDSLVDVVDRYIEIDLNTNELEQLTHSNGGIGCFRQMGASQIQMINGSVKTALLDGNVSNASTNTALFRRQDLYATKVFVFGVHTELGDHAFLSGGHTGNGLHELGFGHSNITIRPSATVHKFIILANSTLSFTFCVGTKPADQSWEDLIDGVIRSADNTPLNVLSNIEI